MKLCTICKKPIILVPSAEARAKADTTGKSAKYYENLFTEHSECVVAKRESETVELMRKLRGEK